jgi:branched-chain amino acid transport system ATP-binding protein
MMFEIEDLHVYYGVSHVIQGITLRVERGETVALLGRNGAGKTTTMRTAAGLIHSARGRIRLGERDIRGSSPYRIARLGLSFVPSGRRVFDTLTVEENLQVAAKACRGRKGSWNLERVIELFPRLVELSRRRAGFLSGGEQQMLKIGRALLTNPDLLILDEPTEGLSPAVVKDLGHWLDLLRSESLTILLTEQNALFALAHSDRGYVLDKGRIRYQADSVTMRDSAEIRAHLGVAG